MVQSMTVLCLVLGGPSLLGSKPASSNLLGLGPIESWSTTAMPTGVTLQGDARLEKVADGPRQRARQVLRFPSGADLDKDGERAGGVTVKTRLTSDMGRWFRLRVRGMAQDQFKVDHDNLVLQVEFFRDGGANALDHVAKRMYALVGQERSALVDAGTNKNLGRASWRSYDLEFRTPFPEVDALTIRFNYSEGTGPATKSDFWVEEILLTPIPVPADYTPPTHQPVRRPKAETATMIPLGGRWFYEPTVERLSPPAEFNDQNAHLLHYLSDCVETPFADNMTAWLRAGYRDIDGKMVTQDAYLNDNVVITFTTTHLVMQTKNLPNHPTAVFPDRERFIDGNPNVIAEQRFVWSLPLEPKVNPNHVAMNETNSNNALRLGPIGVMVNGVAFLNPFDEGSVEAIWRLDRCCGHPSPNSLYHYHKYPVCVKSPWCDDGSGHSPLIGFAFDGFPVYGPYESAGVLAKDDKQRPLNEFNVHEDPERGWHYHVTPGRFPHIIGGYWGMTENQGRQGGGPPPGGPAGKQAFPGKAGPLPKKGLSKQGPPPKGQF